MGTYATGRDSCTVTGSVKVFEDQILLGCADLGAHRIINRPLSSPQEPPRRPQECISEDAERKGFLDARPLEPIVGRSPRNEAFDAEGAVENLALIEVSLGHLGKSDPEGVGEREKAPIKPRPQE